MPEMLDSQICGCRGIEKMYVFVGMYTQHRTIPMIEPAQVEWSDKQNRILILATNGSSGRICYIFPERDRVGVRIP